jgi:predicted TIM-barrel enzyme
MEAGKKVNPDIFFLAHGGPINTPEDVRVILDQTKVHGFVGASSLERMGVEKSLTDLTKRFKELTL